MRTAKKFFYDYSGIVILLVTIFACILAYPMGKVFKTTYVNGKSTDSVEYALIFGEDKESKEEDVDPIEEPLSIEGSFVAAREGLNELGFQFLTKGETKDGSIVLTTYDSYGDKVDEVKVGFYDAMNYHWAKFPLEGNYRSGETYMFDLTVKKYEDVDLFFASVDNELAPEETESFKIDGEELEGRMPLIRYTYKDAVDETTREPIYLFILTIALIAFVIWTVIRSKTGKNSDMLVKIQLLFPWICVVLIGLCLIDIRDVSHDPLKIAAADMNSNDGWASNTSIGVNADSGFRGVFLRSDRYILNEGTYTFDVVYHVTLPTEKELELLALFPPAEEDLPDPNYFTIYDGETKLAEYELDDYSGVMSFEQELEHDSADINFTISFGGGNELLIDSVTINAENGFYSDATFLKILLILGAIIAVVIGELKANKMITTKTLVVGAIIIGIGMGASIPYMTEGLNWAIDLSYHLYRIVGMRDGLKAGQFPVVIYPNALSGNGYLNLMYPAGALYPAAWLMSRGVSLVDSFKFIMIIANILCALFTYMAVKTMAENTSAGILAAVLYTMAPYRFTNLYARGAVGEALAMIFFPLLISGLYHVLIGNRQKWIYLAIGMTGLLYCHVLSFVMGLAMCILFTALFIRKLFGGRRLYSCIKAALITMIMGAGFYIPFLDFYINENLWKNILADNSDYGAYAVRLPSLLGQLVVDDYHQLSLGIVITMCGVIALAGAMSMGTLGRGKLKLESLYGFLAAMTVFGWVLVLMTSEFFPNYGLEQIDAMSWLFENFQFTWRLVGPATLMFAMAGSIYLYKNPVAKKYRSAAFVVLVALTIVAAGRYRDTDYIFGGREYPQGHLDKIVGIPSRDMIFPYEWRLKGTTPATVSAECIVSDEDSVEVVDYGREGTTSTLVYTSSNQEGYVEIPVQAYMGYTATDEVLGKVDYEVGGGNRILIPTVADNMEHTVIISYKIPGAYTVANVVSVIAILLFCVYVLFRKPILAYLEGRKYAGEEEEYDEEYESLDEQVEEQIEDTEDIDEKEAASEALMEAEKSIRKKEIEEDLEDADEKFESAEDDETEDILLSRPKSEKNKSAEDEDELAGMTIVEDTTVNMPVEEIEKALKEEKEPEEEDKDKNKKEKSETVTEEDKATDENDDSDEIEIIDLSEDFETEELEEIEEE